MSRENDSVIFKLLKSADVINDDTQEISQQFDGESYPKLPEANMLELGEVALNIAKDYEVIAIKNNEGEIVYLPFNVAIRLLTLEGDVADLAQYTEESVETLSAATVSIYNNLEEFKVEISNRLVQEITSLSGNVFTTIDSLSATTNAKIAAERERAVSAETALNTALSNLSNHLDDIIPSDTDISNKLTNKDYVDSEIKKITDVIPNDTSSGNPLTNEAFVNSSISTNTATFRGTFNLVSDLHLTVTATTYEIAAGLATVIPTSDNNDYSFVQIPTSDTETTEIQRVDRYKYNGSNWVFEYSLNNSGFTAKQWAAINSGIVNGLVVKLEGLPNKAELDALFDAKQDKLTFDNTPRYGSNNPVTSGGIKGAVDERLPLSGGTVTGDLILNIGYGTNVSLKANSNRNFLRFNDSYNGYIIGDGNVRLALETGNVDLKHRYTTSSGATDYVVVDARNIQENLTPNLKTLNGTSIVGTGDIDIKDIYLAMYRVTPYSSIMEAYWRGKAILVMGFDGIVYFLSKITVSEALFTHFDQTTMTVSSFTVNTSNVYSDITSQQLQENLVSGTNIKTINGNSVLGSGNIDTQEVFVGQYGQTSYTEISLACFNFKSIWIEEDSKPENRFALSCNLGSDVGFVFYRIKPEQIEWFTLDEHSVYSSIYSLDLQSKLTFDNVPTSGSTNPVTSDGIKTALDTKQDTLVSGTNIKTINNQSVLGSGNLDVKDVFLVEYNTTPFADILTAYNAGKVLFANYAGGMKFVNIGAATDNDNVTTFVFNLLGYGAETSVTVLGFTVSLDGGTTIYSNINATDIQSLINANNKLSADLVDDTNATHKFVTATEKTTWSGKQDNLVSGTNIKTINSQSILGSGDLDVKDIFIIEYNVTTYQQVLDAYNAGKYLVLKYTKANPDDCGLLPLIDVTLYSDGAVVGTYGFIFNAIYRDSSTSCVIDITGYSPISSINLQRELTFDNTPTAYSNNPVKSWGIKNALDNKQNKIDSTHKLNADLVDDSTSTNKFVTSSNKTTWNNKQDALVSGTNIKTINNESILGTGNVNFAKYENTLISSESISCETEESVEGVSVYSSTADYYLQPNQKIVFADTIGNNTLYIINYDDISNPSIITSGKGSLSWNNFTNNDVRIQLASSSNTEQTLSASRYWRGTDNVFIAEYEVTNPQDAFNAIEEGKLVIVKKSGVYYQPEQWLTETSIRFVGFGYLNSFNFFDLNSTTWGTVFSYKWQRADEKVSTITGNIDNIKYPTTQAVAGYAQPIIDSSNKLSADLVDDSSTTHKFVTANEKESWDNKIDKVTSATTGNFANFDSNGGIVDSGKKDSDFATAAQGSLADSAYQKPLNGIPASDIAAGVIPDVSQFVTRSVNDLLNYYTKQNTYTQAEVDNLIGSIQHFHYEIYPSLQDITTPATNVLYLIGPTGSGNDRYEEYVYANSDFQKIGDTSIDLSNYVTTQALTSALQQFAQDLQTELNNYALKSQIKTVNRNSLIGSGDVSIHPEIVNLTDTTQHSSGHYEDLMRTVNILKLDTPQIFLYTAYNNNQIATTAMCFSTCTNTESTTTNAVIKQTLFLGTYKSIRTLSNTVDDNKYRVVDTWASILDIKQSDLDAKVSKSGSSMTGNLDMNYHELQVCGNRNGIKFESNATGVLVGNGNMNLTIQNGGGDLKHRKGIAPSAVDYNILDTSNVKTFNNQSIYGSGNIDFAKYEDTLISTELPVFNDIEVLDASTTVYTNTTRYTLKPNQKIVLSDTVGTNKLYLIDATDDNAKSILISKTSSVSWNNFTDSDIVVQLASESDSNQSLTVNTYWRGTDNVFIAEYGVSTYQQVLDAYNVGKVVVCKNNNTFYTLNTIEGSVEKFVFSYYKSRDIKTIELNSNGWNLAYTGTIEATSNKITSISSSSTNTQYPSAKAVAGYAQPKIDSNHKLDADLVDDTNSTHKFVTITFRQF